MPRSLILLAALMALGASTGDVLAQDSAVAPLDSRVSANGFTIAVEPDADPHVTAKGYFSYSLSPADEAAGRIRLENPGAEAVVVELSAVDAETARQGGSAFASTGATPAGTGTWLRLDQPRVTLDPGEQALVDFAVSVPEETRPGQYLAGIAASMPATSERARQAGENQIGAAVIVETRYVIGVQIDVPGEWEPELTITGASVLEQPSGARLGIALRNSGDTFLRPDGSVTLTDPAGSVVLAEPMQLGTFLPGTELTYPVAWPGTPWGGDYTVVVELKYADGQVARYRGTLDISDDAPVVQPTPEVRATPVVPAAAPGSTGVERPTAPVPVSSPMQPSRLALFGGVAVLMVIVPVVVLRSRQPRW